MNVLSSVQSGRFESGAKTELFGGKNGHMFTPQPPNSQPEPEVSVADFDSFYQAEYRSVVGLGYVLAGSQTLAEDLAQEAFIEAHRRWNDISQYDNPAAWVRRVMINRSRSKLRRMVVEAKAITKIGSRRMAEAEEIPERSDEVWAKVRALPARQAQAVALRYLDDLGIAEIAEILDCGTETVKTHLKRGRATLARELKTMEGEVDDA